jgi:hypothetical protein
MAYTWISQYYEKLFVLKIFCRNIPRRPNTSPDCTANDM